MTIYTPTADGLSPYDCPDDGDDVTAASVNVGLQHLGDALKAIYPPTTLVIPANRARWFQNDLTFGTAITALGTRTLATTSDIDNPNAESGFVYFKTVHVMNFGDLLEVPLDELIHYHGWTLSSCTATVKGASGHGGLPAEMPRIALVRHLGGSNQSLASTVWNLDASPDVASYEVAHTISLTPDQNNVIDRSTYAYSLFIQNEGYTNALANLQLHKITLGFAAPT